MNDDVYEWEPNTKTTYDGLLVLNGKIIKYNKLTLKSEILYLKDMRISYSYGCEHYLEGIE